MFSFTGRPQSWTILSLVGLRAGLYSHWWASELLDYTLTGGPQSWTILSLVDLRAGLYSHWWASELDYTILSLVGLRAGLYSHWWTSELDYTLTGGPQSWTILSLVGLRAGLYSHWWASDLDYTLTGGPQSWTILSLIHKYSIHTHTAVPTESTPRPTVKPDQSYFATCLHVHIMHARSANGLLTCLQLRLPTLLLNQLSLCHCYLLEGRQNSPLL